jgi:5-methylcytosine-specific restriction endonuclease McrA
MTLPRRKGLIRVPLRNMPGESSGPVRREAVRPVSARRARENRQRRAPGNTGPSRKVRGLVLARDNFQCVGCGKAVGGAYTWWSLQHRVARGVGGDNSPCNLVTLCGSATSEGCHRRCEDRDREMHERGLWLRSDEDPAMVPVMIASEHGPAVTAWLTDAGTYVFEAPAVAS